MTLTASRTRCPSPLEPVLATCSSHPGSWEWIGCPDPCRLTLRPRCIIRFSICGAPREGRGTLDDVAHVRVLVRLEEYRGAVNASGSRHSRILKAARLDTPM